MGFIEIAKKRYSVRNYINKKVEKEILDKILEAGRIAPTAANKQPQRILVVQSDDGLSRLKKAAKIYNAPVALIICGDKNNVWIRPQDDKKTIDIDATIVTDHLMHQATELELGTLWIAWFDPEILKKEFNIPSNFEPINILLLGYADGTPLSPDRHDKARKKIDETVFYETF